MSSRDDLILRNFNSIEPKTDVAHLGTVSKLVPVPTLLIVRCKAESRNPNPFCNATDRRLCGSSAALHKGLGFRALNLGFFLVRVKVRVYNGL